MTEIPSSTDAPTAARLAQQGRYDEAASMYARLADRSTGVAASRLRLDAAELWVKGEDADSARRQLSRIDMNVLPPADGMRVQLARAGIAMLDGLPEVALSALPADLDRLTRAQRSEALSLRASAHEALGQHYFALRDLVARDAALEGAGPRSDNQQAIWRLVRMVDPAQVEPADDPALSGWLELAEIRRLSWQDPAGFNTALAAWQMKHRQHPAAARFIPQLVAEQRRVAAGVGNIALILPMTGRFSAAATAVRDGFLAAHFRSSDVARRPTIMVYDTAGDSQNAVERYHQAIQEGADFVIGPLQKDAVAAIARLPDRPVPILALNTLDDDSRPRNLFQFGLVPEEEAAQIAERVMLRGLESGIALVPDNEFGLRMLQAFRERLEELGGLLLTAELYDPQQQDHSAPIIRSLAVDESRARQQVLRSVLNLNIQWEPRRRRDADFIFLVGNPQQGRALQPQLRFHHAADLPVFASSHVYTGVVNQSADADLNGVMFTDMPWTIAPDPAAAASLQELSASFGGAVDRNTRLFALGYDAYRLTPVLRHDPGLLGEAVPAATGALHMGPDGRIHRFLTWAQFVNGVARPLR